MISAFAMLIGMAQAAAPAPPAPSPPPSILQRAAPPPPPPPRPGRMKPARARANLASLLSNDDYPHEALRKHEQGTVGFRLHVGTDGKVTGCTVIQPSGSAALDMATCRLMTERARFTPARDRRGRPVTDTVAARIVWRIEEGSGAGGFMPVAATRFVATMRATPAGDVACSIVVNAQPPQDQSCPADFSARMAETAREKGRPIDRTIVTTLTPGGETEPAYLADHGIPLYEAEIVLSIAADGSIVDCRAVRNEGRGPAAALAPPPNPCGTFTPGSGPQFQPATDAAPRTLTISFRGYMRD